MRGVCLSQRVTARVSISDNTRKQPTVRSPREQQDLRQSSTRPADILIFCETYDEELWSSMFNGPQSESHDPELKRERLKLPYMFPKMQ